VRPIASCPGSRRARAIDAALAREDTFRDATAAGNEVRKGEVHHLLADMPVERLREATRERLRVGPLIDAGVHTVQAVLDKGNQLEGLPGIGSRLRPHRVHRPGREVAARSWIRSGGVAVTTYETLNWFTDHVRFPDDLGCVVVDEAHHIKNPDAQRSRRTARMIGKTERAILLTGTPMANHIDEFRTRVGSTCGLTCSSPPPSWPNDRGLLAGQRSAAQFGDVCLHLVDGRRPARGPG